MGVCSLTEDALAAGAGDVVMSECAYCHVVEVVCCNCGSVLVFRRGFGGPLDAVCIDLFDWVCCYGVD